MSTDWLMTLRGHNDLQRSSAAVAPGCVGSPIDLPCRAPSSAGLDTIHTWPLVLYIPAKHEALNRCWPDAGPTSQTAGQH